MSTPINLIGNLQSAATGAATTAGTITGDIAAGAIKATVGNVTGDAGSAVNALTAGAGQLVTRAGLFGVGLVLLCIGLWVVVKS